MGEMPAGRMKAVNCKSRDPTPGDFGLAPEMAILFTLVA